MANALLTEGVFAGTRGFWCFWDCPLSVASANAPAEEERSRAGQGSGAGFGNDPVGVHPVVRSDDGHDGARFEVDPPVARTGSQGTLRAR